MSTIPEIIQSGERLSFFNLFDVKGKNFHVEIPIIQRDYAQGRESTLEVREMFLEALFNYLEENKPNRDLDFVYGSIIKNGHARFIPLDGQQRLTTLFLLHWYLANISGNMAILIAALTIDGKSKFTYETRTSSREFCDALMLNDIDMNALLASDENKKNSLSKTIQDLGWYYLSWENDPTIQSMLTMLDSIHVKFFGKPEFFSRLIDEKNPVVTFLFLNLKEFKLTDDLYIKMNSRGKPLTTFENFKAKFEQHIGSLKWDSATPYKLEYGSKVKQASTQEYFSFKIDTNWANLFWNYRDINGKDNSFDDELMNFIRVIMANQYALDCTIDKDENLEFLIGTQVARKRKDYTDTITFHKYMNMHALTNKSITYLISAFDKLTNGDKKIRTYLNDTFYFDEQAVFEKVLMNKLTYPLQVRFHAYLKYLINNKNDTAGFSDWMRVIFNLSENSVIDGAEDIEKAIKSIESLLPHSSNILDFLRADNIKVDFFNGRQVQEERLKSYLINRSTEWFEAIQVIEKHPYFAGQIGFILEFSKVLEYFEEHGNCSWPVDEDKYYFDEFTNYSKKAIAVFNAVGTDLNKDFLWERAVLSKGDYLISASACRYNFLTSNKFPRDYSWKRLLRLSPLNTIQGNQEWDERRSFVKEVFDDPNFDAKNLTVSLVNICKNKPDDWRKYFIENPELIRYCEQGFIRYESESKILLFKQSQQNHRHQEMYSYNLSLTKLSKKQDFLPFKGSWPYEVRSSDDLSFAILDDWCYNRIYYAIAIYYDTDNQDFATNPYEIKFYKTKGTNNSNDYPAEIKSILDSLKLKWDDENPGYWISGKTEEKTISIIKKLCSQLNSLINE